MATEDENSEPETTCSICFAEFLEPEDLQVHMDQIHSGNKSKLLCCQFCSSCFSNLESYVLHIRDVHLATMKCCKYCSRAFADTDDFRRHENKHILHKKASTYACSQCKDVFTNIYSLEKHELNVHSNDNDGIFLQNYYSLLSSVLNIQAQTFLKSLGSSAVFMCNRCSYTSPNVKNYISHLKMKNCRSIVCDKCSRVYYDTKSLTYHVRKHPECHNYVKDADKKKICMSCYKNVDTLTYNDHVKCCKPVKCQICNTIFESVYQLTTHQAKEHPLAISLTVCQFCHKEFVGTVSLQKHIDRSHKPDFHLYKYTCIYCDTWYFKHPKDLFAHFYSKHNDINPYSCKICDKTFRIRKRFTIHIKLDHKSVGFVEFDEKYHVFFTDKKSDRPFQPTCLLPDSELNVSIDSEKAEDIDESHTESQIENAPTKNEPATDRETDAETVINENKTKLGRKPLKLRFKEQALVLTNINSDFMSATETEANQTENEDMSKSKRKRKTNKVKAKKIKKSKSDVDSEVAVQNTDISDDEPLVNIKKRFKKRNRKTSTSNTIAVMKGKGNKKQLTCKVCNKYCYTFQNYNHHVSLHFKDQLKDCIKCSKQFKSKTALRKHIDTDHGSSRLTETLRSLLERRKQGGSNPLPQLSMAEKFQKTIKTYKKDNEASVATVTEVNEKLSVQKFIESFTPDAGNEAKKPIAIENFVTMISVKAPKREPVIKMTRFNPKPSPSSFNVKLAMPVRFKQHIAEKQKVNIKLVRDPVINESFSVYNDNDTYEDNYQDVFIDYEETVEDKSESVPEVAHEVMLENTEEPKPTYTPRKIIIPKLPTGFKNEIRIATLQTEAPYFKIMKMNEVLKDTKKENANEPSVKLPSGAKLVNVNPLAHLLGNTSIEEVLGNPNKYYKPRRSNFQDVIAKALSDIDKPTPVPKKKVSKKNKSLEVEQ